MIVVPSLSAVTSPEELTEATDWLPDDHEMSLLVAAEGNTDAVSCKVSPMDKLAEDWLMETESTGITCGSCSFSVHEKKTWNKIRATGMRRLNMVIWL